MPTLGVNVVIFDERGRVLLTKREDFEIWCLPSGEVDPGEGLGEAARREAREESGLEVALDRLVGVYSRPGLEKFVGHATVFAGHVIGGSLQTQPGETIDLRWFEPDALPDDLAVLQRLRIRHALEGCGGSVAWTFPLEWRYPPEIDYHALLRLADESGLTRREYHARYLNTPKSPGPVLEAGPDGYPLPMGAVRAGQPREMLSNPHPYRFGASTAIIQDGKILLTRRTDFDVWCLPGGHTDAGESMAETARRETLEETGLEVALTGLVGVYSKLNMQYGGIHVYLYAAKAVGGQLRAQPGEVKEMRFFGPDELPEDWFFAHDQMVCDALAGVRGSAAWTQNVPYPHPGLTRQEIYTHRDRSGLSRSEYYSTMNPLPTHTQEYDELIQGG